MAEVELLIGGHRYQLACADGEEAALIRLGAMVDEQIISARLMTGGLTETRQLLFAAILLADRLANGDGPVASSDENVYVSQDNTSHISTINTLTGRVDRLTARLETLL